MRRGSVGIVFALVTVVGAMGCGRDRSDLTAPARGTTVAPRSGADLRDPFPANDPDLARSIRSFYFEVLAAADRHLVASDAEAGGSGLAELAVPAVVATVEAQRRANLAQGQGFQRVVEAVTAAGRADVEVDGARATIRDCTTDLRTFVTGQTVTTYATRVVTVANHGRRYQAVSLEVPHDGSIGAPGYGCTTPAMGRDAERTMRTVLTEFAAARRRPGAGFPAGLDAVTDGRLQAELQGSLVEQASRGLVITSPQEVAVTVRGLDPRMVGIVVVASACLTYPQGLAVQQAAGGGRREILPPGSRSRLDYAVRVGPDGPPVAVTQVSEELRSSC